MPSWSKRANRTKTPVEILALILPVFAVVIVGYLAVKFSIVPASIAPPLVQFVYHICLPALMFHIIAGESIHALLNWRFWIAFGGGSLLMLGLVYVGGGRWLGKDFGDKAILAFSAVQINAAFVALPVLHVIFGAKGVAPAAIANFIVAAVMFPILAAVMEMTRRTGSGGKKPMWHLARGVFLSPMVWPAVLGFVFAAFAIPVPKTLDSFLVILGSALTPVALFAIGASVNLGDILHERAADRRVVDDQAGGAAGAGLWHRAGTGDGTVLYHRRDHLRVRADGQGHLFFGERVPRRGKERRRHDLGDHGRVHRYHDALALAAGDALSFRF